MRESVCEKERGGKWTREKKNEVGWTETECGHLGGEGVDTGVSD